jgi:DNA-binding CsgD family transcriptional regulator
MGDGEKMNVVHIEDLSLLSHPTQEMITSAIAVLKHELKLTPRQAEVLYWMAEGKTNEEIGIIMECSFFTVKSHAKGIFARLHVDSRTAAAAFAHRAYAAQLKE